MKPVVARIMPKNEIKGSWVQQWAHLPACPALEQPLHDETLDERRSNIKKVLERRLKVSSIEYRPGSIKLSSWWQIPRSEGRCRER